MAGGNTTTSTLGDSLAQLRQSARIQREFATGFQSTCRMERLGKGEGNSYNEVVLDKLTAQGVGEGDRLNNAQAMTDVLFSVEPNTVGVHCILTRQMQDRVSRNVFDQTGKLMQNAIDRKMHLDGLALYDSATFSNPGAGNTLGSGTLSAGVVQIQGNSTEHAAEDDTITAWLHPYQVHDLQTELGAAVGTYTIMPGQTADAYEKGNRAITMVGGAQVRVNGLVPIDGNTDAHGGLHAKSMVVCVTEDIPRSYGKDLEDMDGARALWLYEAYAYALFTSGLGMGRLLSDATAPTS